MNPGNCVLNEKWLHGSATCGPDRDVQQTKSVVTINRKHHWWSYSKHWVYAFQVAAVNTNETGPFSEPVTLGGSMQSCIHYVLLSGLSILYNKYIGTPRLVVVSPVNYITALWLSPGMSSGVVTHYLVQYQSMCDGTVQNVTLDGIVSGLTPMLSHIPGYKFGSGCSQD